MRIASWNINGLRARLDFVLHWLKSRQPDVVGLQELKMTAQDFPEGAFEKEGYRAVIHGQRAWNGVAVLSRIEQSSLQKGLPGQEGLGARLVETKIGQLSFINVYCPNGKHTGHPDFQRKLDWFDELLSYLRERHASTDPLILCGDFNLCPQPIDSWNEEGLSGQIFHTSEERARFRGLTEWGLVDIFRQRYPKTQSFSWWDYRAGAFHRNHGLRIDFILASAILASQVTDVVIDRDYRKKKDGMTASDHAPVYADLDDASLS